MYQNTFLLLCTLPALTDPHLSAEALRTLLTTAMQSQQPLEYVVLQEKTTTLSSAQVVSLNMPRETGLLKSQNSRHHYPSRHAHTLTCWYDSRPAPTHSPPGSDTRGHRVGGL